MKTITIASIVKNEEGLYEGNLKHYFKIVFEKATNLFNDYHNFRHMFHVVYYCFVAIRYYGDRITKLEARAILIAAMFHDFNHPGKTGDDDLNIMRALRGLLRNLLPEDKVLFPLITEIIQATEYPYTVPGEKLPLLCQIIRDADMSQAFSVSWIQQIAFGLAREMGITPRAVLESQGKFLGSVKFLTEWAKQEFPKEVVEAKVAEANALLDCLA